MTQKQDRLLKQYEQWNTQQFKRIYRLWEQKFSRSSTLEEFLAYLAENDVMDVEEYSAKINNIIDVDLNQLSFNRKAQADLTKATIHNNTFDLVRNVNDDFKEHLRTQAVEAFEKGVSPQEFGRMIKAPPLVKGKDGAKRSVSAEVRNRMIARTEAKRALNASNLIINKERGATHWYAIGFTDEVTCTRCIKTYGTPGDYKYYSIEDTANLPPLHPNCRHTAVFVKEGQLPEGADIVGGTTTTEPVTEPTGYQLNNRENSFSDVKITKEQFEKVIKHQSKRANAKLEFGNSIDNETGNLIHSKDIRGSKNRVRVPTSNRPYSVIHNHTNDGGFSGGDVYAQLTGGHQEVCYATTPKGVWIMRDTSQTTFSKKEGFLSDNAAIELQYKIDGKYREFAKEGKTKYQEAYDNAKTPQEKEKIRQKLNNEVFTNYNNWLLDEFAVGKRRDWLIEIEFIPKEKLKDVQF